MTNDQHLALGNPKPWATDAESDALDEAARISRAWVEIMEPACVEWDTQVVDGEVRVNGMTVEEFDAWLAKRVRAITEFQLSLKYL